MQVVADEGPGGFADAEDEFVEEFDEEVGHGGNGNGEEEGAVVLNRQEAGLSNHNRCPEGIIHDDFDLDKGLL
ncbi:MAG: hypothetical protein AMXMBFR60_11940 [Chloroflexota bacterium]